MPRAMRLTAFLALFMGLLVASATCQEVEDLAPELEACRAQLAESSTARASLETRLADADSLVASSRSASDAAASRLASATAALEAEKSATFETTRKLQATVMEKATLKAEIAALEEQLMNYANAPTPGPLDHLAAFAGSVIAVVKDVAPGVAAEGLETVKSASGFVIDYVAPVVPALQKASRDAADAAAAAATKAGPAVSRVANEARAAAASAAPALDAAVAKAEEIRDAIQRVIFERVSTIETITTRVETTRLESLTSAFATGIVAAPVALVAARVFFLVAAAIFGKRSKVSVPRRVKQNSVPLRTPTPDKKTAPFGARTRAMGRTIRSPEGEVLRFA